MRWLFPIAILLVSSPAHADITWAVHIGGGLEAGFVTNAVRPDGVAEAGTLVEYISSDGNAGIGATVEAVGRLTSRFEDAEEVKADAMFRWARDDRRFRFGVGAGVRVITPADGTASIHGYDLTRIDLSGQLASWEMSEHAPRMAIDGYFSWTFGCYSDAYTIAPVGDTRPMQRTIGCSESITSTYVLGLRTSVTWQ
ncbi:MAG: hypothetical protein IPQ07_39050 [Myxococcales bacterium]|nr:hypothetical protein [Myxococcales bacterium]